MIKHGHARKCGLRTPEHRAWGDMKGRCMRTTHARYADWGGRGIKVCKRWMKFENFLADMGPRPSPKHSLDRKNNNGNYTPSNCRWATPDTQRVNKRVRKDALRVGGKCAKHWQKVWGCARNTTYVRMRKLNQEVH